ncbi:MAG: excisionase family DNA-binding protein [Actinomycetes bacterium]
MANAKRNAASARASKASATSRSAAASKTAKTAQASKTSQATTTGTSAKRAARNAVTGKSTTNMGSKSAARGPVVTKKAKAPAGGREPVERVERVRVGRRERAVEPTVRPIRVAGPRVVRVERLDAGERAKLRELDALVAGGQDIEEVVVVGTGERRVSLTRTLLEGLAALGKVFEVLDRGASVTVVADDDQAELTSQEAADLLDVSRPYVVKLARNGALAHHRVGNRHRFMLADVLDYRDQMRAVREEALAELAPSDGYTAADF